MSTAPSVSTAQQQRILLNQALALRQQLLDTVANLPDVSQFEQNLAELRKNQAIAALPTIGNTTIPSTAEVAASPEVKAPVAVLSTAAPSVSAPVDSASSPVLVNPVRSTASAASTSSPDLSVILDVLTSMRAEMNDIKLVLQQMQDEARRRTVRRVVTKVVSSTSADAAVGSSSSARDDSVVGTDTRVSAPSVTGEPIASALNTAASQ